RLLVSTRVDICGGYCVKILLLVAVHCDVCFFFPAEDGIRDRNVTGVQTCALPILTLSSHGGAVDNVIVTGADEKFDVTYGVHNRSRNLGEAQGVQRICGLNSRSVRGIREDDDEAANLAVW